MSAALAIEAIDRVEALCPGRTHGVTVAPSGDGMDAPARVAGVVRVGDFEEEADIVVRQVIEPPFPI